MAKAIDASDVRDALETVPNMSLPSGVDDPILEDQIRRKTGRVLSEMGRDEVPTEEPEKGAVEDAVLQLVVNQVASWTNLSDSELQEAIATADETAIGATQAEDAAKDAGSKNAGIHVSGTGG